MPTTPNKSLDQPSTGAEIGIWGNSLNTNMGIVDNSLGGVLSLALAGNVVLSASQYQNIFISLTGTLGANTTVTLPSVGSFYSVQNLTANTSAFAVIMKTAAVGSQQIGIPPDTNFVDIMTDGANVKFRGLGRVGSYMDIGSSYVPPWITACTVPPYLYCNGGTFSSATYPVLTTILGSTRLPDCRGRSKFSLDAGTGRNTAWMAGNTLKATGGVTGTFLNGGGDLYWQIGPNLRPEAVAGVSSDQSIDPSVPRGYEAFTTFPPSIVQGITLIRSA